MLMKDRCKAYPPKGEDMGWKYIFTYGYTANVYGKGNQRKIVNRDTRRIIVTYTIGKRLRERVNQLACHNLISQTDANEVLNNQME